MKTLMPLLLIVILTSCKKFYSCDCTLRDTTVTNGKQVTYNNQVRSTKKTAEQDCDNLESSYNNNERDCYIVK